MCNKVRFQRREKFDLRSVAEMGYGTISDASAYASGLVTVRLYYITTYNAYTSSLRLGEVGRKYIMPDLVLYQYYSDTHPIGGLTKM